LMPNPHRGEEHTAGQNNNPADASTVPPWPPLPSAEQHRPREYSPGPPIVNNEAGPPDLSIPAPPERHHPWAGDSNLPDDRDPTERGRTDHRSYRDVRERRPDLPQENFEPPREFSSRSPAKGAGIRDDGTYEIQPLDSYWTISETLYGTGAYFKALAEHNRGKGRREESLKIGESISAPPVEELQQKYPDLCPQPRHHETLARQAQPVNMRQAPAGGRKYTVTEGDTLFDIARYELGKASRWVEIYEMNREVLGKDIDYLIPGTELALPGESPIRSDPLTRRPTPWYQR
jgi:nucleoid-associated protein YgaU